MQRESMTPSRLWPAISLAARLGVDQKWLAEEAAAGRIPGVQAGRTWLFEPEAVEESLLERARRPRREEGTRDAE